MIGFVSAATLIGVFDADGSSTGGVTKIALGMLLATAVSIPLLPGAILADGIPALLTGTIYWSWRRRVRLPTWQSVVIVGLTGGGACAVSAIAIEGSLRVLADVNLWKVFILPGVIAGNLVAWLVEHRVWSGLGSPG